MDNAMVPGVTVGGVAGAARKMGPFPLGVWWARPVLTFWTVVEGDRWQLRSRRQTNFPESLLAGEEITPVLGRRDGSPFKGIAR